MRDTTFVWHGKLQRIRLDPADSSLRHLAHRTSPRRLTMDAQTEQHPKTSTEHQLWYKDAIIYQLHVKSFFDSNDDGIGDFPGLISKLDYIADLGVNAIWLLPFYPSPAARRRLRHQRLSRRASRLRDARGLPALRPRGACPRHPRHHRTGDQSHLRPASLVSARAARASPDRPGAISMSGRTPIRDMPARASSSSTPSIRTGPGTRLPAPITGTAFIRISRI